MLGDIIKENFKTTFKDFINFKYSKEFDAKEILGYIYAVLYSNIYRTKFIEFLKIDFPKIIFVDSVKTFEKLSKLGIKLINVHLMKNDSELDSNIGIHIGDNNHIIEKIFYNKDTKELYYNSLCKFINTPYEVYEYFIGAYQVLRSYLKYRKGRELSIYEIEHIEKVIKILHYTINIQKQIDLITCKLKEFDSQNCNL
ncbi:Adenine-specific methyltransferase (plasmid) [Borrelia hermsii YBT]|uniref:Adenine-specific methyltransferase n=1 Tax=Borrelia hermsii YBT TaxID=1313295 RepID=W5T1V7_BORHE|nr:type ISP restriction/modification enzyme [Borrelia hermsii]AHH13172.1 Adenine-specific methyltransferase [Borrelia hermsii YBT]